jgi:hypothetical protein
MHASYIPDDSVSLQSRVLSAVSLGSLQRNEPIDAHDVAQMEGVSIVDAKNAIAMLFQSGKIQGVFGSEGYRPAI